MKVINLFGGPGSGKSTTAAGLFFKMKMSGKINSVELVTEFAKDLVYAERLKELKPENQMYITVKQYSRLYRLIDNVDYIITDSPIIQGLLYTPLTYFPSFKPLVKEIFRSFENINIFLNRTKPYRSFGRTQTEEESDIVSMNIEIFLKDNNISYTTVDGDMNAPGIIFNYVIGQNSD
jgi:hypothetical protein